MVGAKEERHALDSTKEVGFTSCSSISDSSCDANTPRSCYSRRSGGQTKRSSQAGWTDEEDNMLTEVVKKYNGRNWKKIAESIPGRTDVQCLHRWQKVLNPELVKGPWTKEEDDRITELVQKHGFKKWSVIAKYLSGRIGKQCRERWHNHLDPAIKKEAWTKAEELTLAYYHHIYGNKWAEIARFLPGRTDNAIKNHWNSSKKRIDLNMPPVCPPRIASPELNNNNSKNGSKEISLVQKSPNCSTNLALGNNNNDDYMGFTRYSKSQKLEPLTSPDVTKLNHSANHLQMISETPERPRTDSIKDLKLANSPDGSFLSLSTFGFSDGKSETNKKHFGSLCYPPPELKNPVLSPVTGPNFRQVSCSTPPHLALSISASSPESILRNSALSYKNTPSIIRKRTSRSSPSTPGQPQKGSSVCGETVMSGSDPWLHRAQPVLGRRLEYMFDSEWDPTMVRCGPCGTPASVTPSSKTNVMLTP